MTPARRAARRIRTEESGMTLVEVLIAISVGTVVMFAAFMAMTAGQRGAARVADRIEATQRGRLAMERITRDLRSQVCLSSDQPAVEWGTGTGLQFYSSVAQYQAGAQKMERRRIEWTQKTNTGQVDTTTAQIGDIVETVWESTSNAAPYTFPATAKSRNILAEDVERETPTTPIFRYFGYTITTQSNGIAVGRPSSTPFATTSTVMGVPNSVHEDNLGKIVMMDVKFLARPRRATVVKSLTVPFYNRVSVRTADPTDPENSPLCAF